MHSYRLQFSQFVYDVKMSGWSASSSTSCMSLQSFSQRDRFLKHSTFILRADKLFCPLQQQESIKFRDPHIANTHFTEQIWYTESIVHLQHWEGHSMVQWHHTSLTSWNCKPSSIHGCGIGSHQRYTVICWDVVSTWGTFFPHYVSTLYLLTSALKCPGYGSHCMPKG